MSFNRIVRDFLFLLFAIYYLLNCLYTEGSVYSKICIVAIILISGIYFVKTLLQNEHKSIFYNAWTIMIILNITGFIFSSDVSEGFTRDMFKNILSGMLPFYPFFYFAEKGLLKASHLTVFLLLMVPVIIILFITNQSTFVYQFDVDESEVVNNISYSFAGLIPFVFLIRKRKFLSVGLIVIITLFIIQGAKRGAIFAGLIGLIMYFYYQMITIEKDNRIQGFLTASIILIGLSGFVYNSMAGNDFVKERMTSMLEGDSSERNIIYTTILDKWYSSDTILKMIFGYGFASSIWIAGIYAHNDWLEMLSNFGLLGIFVYLSLFYAAVRCCLKREWSIDKRILMMTITLIWFFISMVSMAYTDQGFFMQAILLGYITGSNTQNLE